MPNCPSCDDIEMIVDDQTHGAERVCPECGYREEN